MNWDEYVSKAKVTATYKTKKELVMATFCGLWEELHEFEEKMVLVDHEMANVEDLTAEIGDFIWYLAVLSDHYQHDPSNPLTGEEFDLQEHLGPMCQAIKKSVREHDWELRDPKRRDVFCFSLDALYNLISGYCDSYNIEMSSVMVYNINKLADRAKRGTIMGDGDRR